MSTTGIYKNWRMMIHRSRSTDFGLGPNLQGLDFYKKYISGFLLL